MATISSLNARIDALNGEIRILEGKVARCETLKTKLEGIEGSINQIISKLYDVSSNLSNGLIVDGKGVGEKEIGDKITSLKNCCNHIENSCLTAVKAKKKELNNAIDNKKTEISLLEKQKENLWVKISSKWADLTKSK